VTPTKPVVKCYLGERSIFIVRVDLKIFSCKMRSFIRLSQMVNIFNVQRSTDMQRFKKQEEINASV
jgi:hypothetical protein